MEKFRDSEAEEAELMFARAEKIKRGEMERRRATAGDNTSRIRLEVSRKIRNRELEWQGTLFSIFSFFFSGKVTRFLLKRLLTISCLHLILIGLAAKWLQVARRKVQVKKAEDAASAAGKKKRAGGK
jgi:hypothetical protein